MKRRPLPSKRSGDSKRSGELKSPRDAEHPAGTFAAGDPTATTGSPAVTPRVDAAPRVYSAPPMKWKRLLSVLVILHVVAVTLSLFAVVEPSQTHAELLSLVQPYLRATRFDIDDRPIYLTHDDRSDQPMRIQVSDSVSPGEDSWRTIEPPGTAGLAGSDRYHRWLATAVLLQDSEQPGLVAELLLGFVRSHPEARSVRIVLLPTDLTSIADETAESVYVARIARGGDRVSLVHVPPAAQSAVAVPGSGAVPDSGEER